MKLKSIHLFMLFLFFLIIAPFVNQLVEGMGGMRSLESMQAERNKLDDEMSKQPRKVSHKSNEAFDSDAYMLKSQMVPPVCPRTCDKQREKPCPPCPPCARCPEPAFDCKKVPNYDINTPEVLDKYLPKPILTDFSKFEN